jgi:hypothetical protein
MKPKPPKPENDEAETSDEDCRRSGGRSTLAADDLLIDALGLSTTIFAGEASAADATAGELTTSASASVAAPIVYRPRPIVDLHPIPLEKAAARTAFYRLRFDRLSTGYV